MERNEIIHKHLGQCKTQDGQCSYLNGHVLCRRFRVQLEGPHKCLNCCNQTYGHSYVGRP